MKFSVFLASKPYLKMLSKRQILKVNLSRPVDKYETDVLSFVLKVTQLVNICMYQFQNILKVIISLGRKRFHFWINTQLPTLSQMEALTISSWTWVLCIPVYFIAFDWVGSEWHVCHMYQNRSKANHCSALIGCWSSCIPYCLQRPEGISFKKNSLIFNAVYKWCVSDCGFSTILNLNLGGTV